MNPDRGGDNSSSVRSEVFPPLPAADILCEDELLGEVTAIMPVYEYEHREPARCDLGGSFEWTQSIKDAALKECPRCGAPIRRLISRPYISTPAGDSRLKELGFTKLVRRDQGVYENVTASGGESRIMEADKPETMPHLHRKIKD